MRSAIQRLPPRAPGMTIGLFGGSFNPPHAGHRHVSLVALTRLQLDAVWWLVSPGNPLKDTKALAPLNQRAAAARALLRHPRLHVTDIEAAIDSCHTAQTLAWLVRHCPGITFVWIMGADNLLQFHRWQHWRRIASLMPLAVVARPGTTLKAPLAHAARCLAAYRVPERRARTLKAARPPAWIFLHAPLKTVSSTLLRKTKGA